MSSPNCLRNRKLFININNHSILTSLKITNSNITSVIIHTHPTTNDLVTYPPLLYPPLQSRPNPPYQTSVNPLAQCLLPTPISDDPTCPRTSITPIRQPNSFQDPISLIALIPFSLFKKRSKNPIHNTIWRHLPLVNYFSSYDWCTN